MKGKTKLELSKQEIFEFNGFSKEKRIVLFDLKESSKKFDSLFIYSNLNEAESFVLCKDEKNCDEDLMGKFGRSMPPLVEGAPRHSSLRSAYIHPLDSLLGSGLRYLAIRVPVWSSKSNKHQLVIKVDLHLRSDRVTQVSVPNIIDYVKRIDLSDSKNATFRRVYLSEFTSVWQAFTLTKAANSLEDSCDSLLTKESLMSSVLAMQFVEQVSEIQANSLNEQIHHSNAVGTKSNNLTLRLVSNHEVTSAYIDLISFSPSHLAKLGSIDQSSFKKCSNQFIIELKVSNWAILGQWIRFYAVLMPAFVVLVLQFYDFVLISQRVLDFGFNKTSFLILSQVQTCFRANFVFSLALCVLTWLASMIDSNLLENDFIRLKKENIFHPMLSLSLYWSAFAIISVATCFLSLLFCAFSFLLNRLVLKIFTFIKIPILQKCFMFLHLLFAIICGVISSSLGQATLFYGELVRLCLGNPAYEASVSHDTWIEFFSEQIRMLLVYLLLVLNLPSLIVWTKSLNSNEVKPLFELKGDAHLIGFFLLLILHLFQIMRRNLIFFVIKNEYLSILVLGNCVLTGLYSTLSLHRLSYFVLAHLALMSLRKLPIDSKKAKTE